MPDVVFFIIAALIVAAGIAAAVYRRSGAYVTVYEYERGLKYLRGRISAVLEPGRYWCWKPTTTISRIDMRASSIVVPNQEILTKDGIAVKMSLLATYRVVDPQRSVTVAVNTTEMMYYESQRALRAIVATRTVDEVLAEREAYGADLLAQVGAKALEFGIQLEALSVRDLTLTGEYKRALANVASARTVGLAALERARGESASLRNLANAARLIDESPNLLPLRMLQALDQGSGNTIVFGTDAAFRRAGAPAKSEQAT